MAFKRPLVLYGDGISEITPADIAVAGALVPLSTTTASNVASVDFVLTSWVNSNFAAYFVVLANIVSASDQVQLFLRTSSDGGSSYDAGAGNYRGQALDSNTTPTWACITSDTGHPMCLTGGNGFGNASNESGSGTAWIYRPSAAAYCGITSDLCLAIALNSETRRVIAASFRTSAADVDAIRFIFSSGNISSGEFRLYGLKNAA